MNCAENRKPEKSGDLILVMGCPRSGTNLLAMRLMQEFHIVFPFESHFIPLFWRWRFLYGDIRVAERRKRLLEDIYLFLAVRDSHVASQMSDSRTRESGSIASVSLVKTSAKSATICAGALCYADLVWETFQTFKVQEGGAAVGDKSAYYYPESIEQLQAAVPNIKVIHIARDGRDAFVSWRRSWFRPTNIVEAARLWSCHVVENRSWGKRHPDRYCEVKYEDLLQRNDEVMARLGAFLDLERKDEPSKYAGKLGEVLAGFVEHKYLKGTTRSGNSGDWKRSMSRFEADLFHFVAERSLKDFGYSAPAQQWSRFHSSLLALAAGAGLLSSPFSANWIRRHLKSVMPLLFVLGGRRWTRLLLKRRAGVL